MSIATHTNPDTPKSFQQNGRLSQGNAGSHEHPLVSTPANWIPGPKQGQWTFDAYAAIPEDSYRYEVVEGVLYLMPAPGWDHQGIVGTIFSHLSSFVLAAKLGKARMAPIDVELSPGNVVQPDVLVLLNEHLNRVVKKRVVGAPDLVVEVASPSTSKIDRSQKLAAYAGAGVPEYWLVDPEQQAIEVLVLENGCYRSLGIKHGDNLVLSPLLPDLPPARAEQFFEDM